MAWCFFTVSIHLLPLQRLEVGVDSESDCSAVDFVNLYASSLMGAVSAHVLRWKGALKASLTKIGPYSPCAEELHLCVVHRLVALNWAGLTVMRRL